MDNDDDTSPEMSDAEEWALRNANVVRERVALAVAVGGSGLSLTVTSDPVEPNDDDPCEHRDFFIDAKELVHGPGGVISGVAVGRWKLVLERVGVVDPNTPVT